MVEIESVRCYQEPDFPSRLILDEHPELLALVPNRWRANPALLTALSGLCLLTTGWRCLAEDNAAQPAARVAPVFQHGEGRGAVGCVVVNPPVFLSEEEARQVITEEAKKAGIRFQQDITTLPKVSMPLPNSLPPREGPPKEVEYQVKPLTLDGTDRGRRISYEYVSKTDWYEWYGKDRPIPFVHVIDAADTAKRVRDSLEKTGYRRFYTVFYDPMVPLKKPEGYDKGYAQLAVELRQTAREELRKQVQDFIKWLKAQGVI